METESIIKSITYWTDIEYNKLLPIDQVNQGYNLFADNFSLNRLKNLDGELLIDTIFYIENKKGLTYWLEFKDDDEFKTNTYGSIVGGSSSKCVMFKRNLDNRWVTGNPQNPIIFSIEEAIDLGRKLRNSLVGRSPTPRPDFALMRNWKVVKLSIEIYGIKTYLGICYIN